MDGIQGITNSTNHTVPLCKKIGEKIDKMELVYVLQEDSRN